MLFLFLCVCVCVPSFFLFFKETNSVDFFLLGVRLTESVSNQMDWFTEFFSLDWVFGGSACSKKKTKKNLVESSLFGRQL